MIYIGGDIIKKYPFVKQTGLKDCAAASVLMILKYYKGFINAPKLEEMLKTTRNGTTAYHIIKTLKQLGFHAYGVKLKKLKETKIPFIALIIVNRSYKHYIVVYEITRKHIKYADPARKIKRINKEQFYKLIKDSFTQKRKNLRNNRKNYDKEKLEKILKTLNKDLTFRAEQLSIDDFIEISNNL